MQLSQRWSCNTVLLRCSICLETISSQSCRPIWMIVSSRSASDATPLLICIRLETFVFEGNSPLYECFGRLSTRGYISKGIRTDIPQQRSPRMSQHAESSGYDAQWFAEPEQQACLDNSQSSLHFIPPQHTYEPCSRRWAGIFHDGYVSLLLSLKAAMVLTHNCHKKRRSLSVACSGGRWISWCT